MSEAKVSLGGKEYPIKMLSLTQLLELAVVLEDESLGAGLVGTMERAVRIVSLALRAADGSMTEDHVRAIAAPFNELDVAAGAILKLTGLKTGEPEPVAS